MSLGPTLCEFARACKGACSKHDCRKYLPGHHQIFLMIQSEGSARCLPARPLRGYRSRHRAEARLATKHMWLMHKRTYHRCRCHVQV